MSDQQAERGITIKENGPYIVSGAVPLVRKRPIVSEHGEPLGWGPGRQIDDGVAYALCRCGGSANKPYCDGTHAGDDFDGTETADPASYAERSTELGGTGLTVRDDRSICEHAGFCGNQVTNAWEMVSQTDDTIVRSQVIAMVERCPSGALTYSVEPEGEVEPDLATQVAVVADGPLWVTGGVPIERSDGQAMERRNRVTLCRCGQSANKPHCDGRHKESGFSDS